MDDEDEAVGWKYLCSLGEASEIAGVSKRTLVRRIRDGTVVAKKVGSAWVVDVRTLDVMTPEEKLRRLRAGTAEVFYLHGMAASSSSSMSNYTISSNSSHVQWRSQVQQGMVSYRPAQKQMLGTSAQ